MHTQIALLIAISISAISSHAAGVPVKVLSLNFNSEVVPLVDRGRDIRDLRFNAMVNWINENKPDVVLFQEAWNYKWQASVVKPLAKAVGYHQAFALDMGFPGFLFDSNGVMVRKGLKVEKKYHMTLPHSAAHLGNGRKWILSLGSASRAIGLKIKLTNGESLYAFSTHLVTDSDQKRLEQMQAIEAKIQEILKKEKVDPATAHIVIGGDFNQKSDTVGYQYFDSIGYQDTWKVAHPGESGVSFGGDPYGPYFNPFTTAPGQFPAQDELEAVSRIDYIFAKGVKTLASTLTFTQPEGGVWMSDHYANLSTLAVGGDVAESIPNPATDLKSEIPPTVVVRVKESLFACPDHVQLTGGHCVTELQDGVILGPRGVTILNESKNPVLIRWYSHQTVFTKTSHVLGPGEVASYFMPESGSFDLDLEDGDLNHIQQHYTYQKSN